MQGNLNGIIGKVTLLFRIGQTLIFFQNLPFMGIYVVKNEDIHFLGALSFFLVHIQLTPSEGPKGFVN